MNDLAAFVQVAEEKSFTRAAARLGMSPSALSHAMRGLETRLGMRLLARTTRSVSTTEAGERLLQTLRPAFEDIDAGLSALAGLRDKPSGTVRITTFKTAAMMVLEPVLPTFMKANPDVSVEISVDESLVDIVAARFDAGIRFGENIEKDMVSIRIAPDLRPVVVGAPEYFRQRPLPLTPNDLAQHQCINYRMRSSGLLHPWEFEEDGRSFEVKVQGPLVLNDGPMIMNAALAGLGLAYMFEHDVAPLAAQGRLVRMLERWCPTFPGFYLYHPSRRQVPAALTALIQALRDQLGRMQQGVAQVRAVPPRLESAYLGAALYK